MNKRIILPSVNGPSSVKMMNVQVGDGHFKCKELVVDGKTLRYVVDQKVSQWRVNTLFTKEPMTIEWIHSCEPGEVLIDVSANIGLYSCYAEGVAGATA